MRRVALSGLAAVAALGLTVGASAEELKLRIVGGLGGVTQYTQLEEPFWRDEIVRLSGGRVTATIHPFDRSGLRAADMLQLIRLGVVPFGTALLSLVANDEPELNAVDLPGIAPDFATLRRAIAAFRPQLETILRDRYGVELLSVNVYPAQVIYCAKPFTGLNDLTGRRVRTSSLGQSEMMTALGAIPVVTPFAEIVPAMRRGAVDCAITGTLSGLEIGLTQTTTAIHAMAINWGISIFGANGTAWAGIAPELQTVIASGLRDLERRIWDAAERDTALGISCNTGAETCTLAARGRLQLVPVTARDEARRREIVATTILPRWMERCGPNCGTHWNKYLADVLGLRIETHAAAASN